MAKRIDLPVEALLPLVEGKRSSVDIAEELGVSKFTVYENLRRHGLKPGGRPKLDEVAIAADFDGGLSVKAIARKYGVERDTIGVRLRRQGREPRGPSDAQRLRLSRMTAAQRAAIGQRARERLALSRTGKPLSSAELHVYEELLRRGYFPVLNFPVFTVRGGYNLDLAFPQEKLAIELDGYWHRTEAPIDPRSGIIGSRKERDERRATTLAALGWEVLHTDIPSKNFRPVLKANKIMAWLKKRGLNPVPT